MHKVAQEGVQYLLETSEQQTDTTYDEQLE